MASLPLIGPIAAPRFVRGRAATWALPAILATAVLLRLLAASVPSVHHPDEVFQYLEPAHRMVFGYGIVTWEYHYGIRSWLFPLLLAAPMRLGALIAPDSTAYLWLPHMLMVAVSLSIPVSGWAMGRPSSRAAGLFAAFVGATWAEFVYFAPHTLSENMATAAILPAAAILSTAAGPRDRRALVAAGLLLGFAGLIRFQLAPAIAVLTVLGCGRDGARWRPLLLGGAAMAAIGAGIDLAMGGVPFGWLVENVRQNLLQDRAAQYGVLGPLGYVSWIEHVWGWTLVPIIVLARIGWRRQPALGWAATANLLFHSLIAHKEYRFIEFSAAAFVLLAAIGTVDAVRLAHARFPRVTMRNGLILAGAAWLAASATVAVRPEMHANWIRSTDTLAATRLLRDDPAVCGVALVLPDLVQWGGYSYLHRDIPVSFFDPNDPALAGRSVKQALTGIGPYNRIVVHDSAAAIVPTGFARQACVGDDGSGVCIYARPGACRADAGSPFLLDHVLDRVDRQMRDNIRRGIRPTS